jgi:hypothetical protein
MSRKTKRSPATSLAEAIVILSSYLDLGWTEEDLREALAHRLAKPKRERKRKVLPGQMSFLDCKAG